MRRSRSRLVVVVAAVGCGGSQATPTTARVPTCPTTPIAIGGQDDVAALAGCRELAGVAIRTGAALDLAPLRELAAIHGDLVIGPSVGLEDVTFAGLAAIDGALRVASNHDLRHLRMPALARVDAIDVANNVVLATLAWKSLAAVRGSLAITANPALELVDLPALASVGELAIADDPELALVDTGALATIGSLRVERVPALPEETIERLREHAPK